MPEVARGTARLYHGEHADKQLLLDETMLILTSRRDNHGETEVGMSQDRWLTVEQVAETLQVHIDTVRLWLRAGRLKGSLLSRRAGWRVRESDLDAFMEDRAGKAAAA